MAQEQGAFTLEDVAEGICDKMIRRHPHVFGENAAWEQTKAVERSAKRGEGEHVSALDDVALALPALVRGQKIQKRAARVGFDWPEVAQVSDKLHEELAELDHRHCSA